MANATFYSKATGRDYTLFTRFTGGPWYLRIQHGGKNIMRSVGKDLPAAKANAKTIIEDLVAGDQAIDREATFDDLLERFAASRQMHAQHTRDNDAWKLRTIRESCVKTVGELKGKPGLALNMPARNIRTSDVLAWMSDNTKNWKGRTANHFRAFLFGAFQLGVADRLLTKDENPFASKLIKRQPVGKTLRFVPTEEQRLAIIDHVRERNGDDFADYFEFIAAAGLGEAEVLNIRKRDVEFRGGKSEDAIKLMRVKTGVHFEIPIYRWLRPVLDRRMMRGFSDDQHLFNVADADDVLRDACIRLGYTHKAEYRGRMKTLSKFTPRSLRCMLIKRLYDSGVPLKRIAEWQGHQDGGQLILNTYTEVFCDSDAAALQADLAKVA